MTKLATRRLGRTNRQVSTLGLGGQASIQWTAKGIDPVAIIEKAIGLGINYLDTSNIYGPSQENYGKAFKKLGLLPDTSNYNKKLREKIFLATKTHFRTARRPENERFRTDFSEGMGDGFKTENAVDDVKRSLSLMFGDGKGGYPKGAYLDAIQFHNLNTFDEIDMLFEGFSDPLTDRPWMGALAAMLDLREGTNRSGCNPDKEKLVKHIGITGHWSTATHIYAIQRDELRILDTLLVTINPSDGQYMNHQHNAIAVAQTADMGIIGMKIFADAAYYHKEPQFSNTPADVYYEIGSEQIPSNDLVQYALSIPGISTVIPGIGRIDDNPKKCQLEQNLKAAQITKPLNGNELNAIEEKVAKAGKHKANSYFQRPIIGLTPPRNVGAESDTSMPMLGRNAVRISWDTAYAGNCPIDQYEVLRNGEVIGKVHHAPQFTRNRFVYDDQMDMATNANNYKYKVVAVDKNGEQAESVEMVAI